MRANKIVANEEILFLSAGFDDFQIGLARNDEWILKEEETGHIADNLQKALAPCIPQINFNALTIFLINGPGSTLGIRTLCAFVRTLCSLKKIQPATQIYTTNGLAFAQAYLTQKGECQRPICARVNLTQTLCLKGESSIHVATEEEKHNAIWLPHPCLKEQEIFKFSLDSILPILQKGNPWIQNPQPDVFQI